MSDAAPSTVTSAAPTLGEAFSVWLRIGLLSFGGPSGQIALMHEELVERRRWLTEQQFLHALNFCMLLPGPEAHQLSIYAGWLLHGRKGGLVAGLLFVLPGALLLLGISALYLGLGAVPAVGAVFYGLKPAVVAIVAGALIRIGQRALKTKLAWGTAAGAFLGLFWLNLPFPIIIIVAGLFGALLERNRSSSADAASTSPTESTAALGKRTFLTLLHGGVIWWLPVGLLALVVGTQHVLVREAVFFGRAALITFGGAYAVLPYVAQQAVQTHGWLSTAQMMDGLALAETTPGPLVLVLQFVGCMGGWNHAAPLAPWLGALAGAVVSSWMTFVPSFIFIFAGAPWVEHLKNEHRLNGALRSITAAVVGVILNLSVWFAWHVFLPAGKQIDYFALLLAGIGMLALWRWRVNVLWLVAAGAFAGIVRWLLL